MPAKAKTFADWYKTDVTKHIEKKGKFSYLSWTFAVREFRMACPNGTWEIKHFDGAPYCATEAGGFVEVTVIPDATKEPVIGFTQVHPVLDNRNQTIKQPNAFQINTSIQRCLVKAIALATGIGLHIYAGEDLPTDEKPVTKQSRPPADVNWKPLLELLSSMNLDQLVVWSESKAAGKGTYLSAVEAYGAEGVDEVLKSNKEIQEGLA